MSGNGLQTRLRALTKLNINRLLDEGLMEAGLRGDPSDKVPGAPRVGAAGAATLLRRYGCLEALLEAGRFPAMAERLRLFKSLATMNRKAPLPNLRGQRPTWHKAAALAREWELNQLAHKLEELDPRS